MNSTYSNIQQAFVHRYMNDHNGVLGVRIRKFDGKMTLIVEVDREVKDLPTDFRGLPVRTQYGNRAKLAYSCNDNDDTMPKRCTCVIDNGITATTSLRRCPIHGYENHCGTTI